MNTPRSILFAAAWALLALAPYSRAETGITNTINGSSINYASNYYVGSNGAFNALIVTNAGKLKVTGLGIVGNTALAASNYAIVIGPGSLWSNSSNLEIGIFGSGNRLTIANSGQVFNGAGYIGDSDTARNNSVIVTGQGSVWSNSSWLYVGNSGSGNSLSITNGGTVFNTEGRVGVGSTASNNSVIVTGPGSVWSNSLLLGVGNSGSGNSLTIANSGHVFSLGGGIGWFSTASNNSVIVTGPGSVWSNSSNLPIGGDGSGNSLSITSGGTVAATNIVIGYYASSGNGLTVSGGNLYATNVTSTGALDVRYGTLTLNSGTVTVNNFLATNGASSVVNFSGGLLRSGGSSVSNGVAFTVGDGTNTATLDLLGGTHSFADGLMLSTNSSLIGSGNISGNVTNFSIIAPGHSIGTINITGGLMLTNTSELDMEIAGPGTNDQLDISGLLQAGGLLNVTLTNGYTGNAGDTFDLFNFGSLSGTFAQTNLPALGGGLWWNTGNLYTLGEIQIVPEPGTGALLTLGDGRARRAAADKEECEDKRPLNTGNRRKSFPLPTFSVFWCV